MYIAVTGSKKIKMFIFINLSAKKTEKPLPVSIKNWASLTTSWSNSLVMRHG